MTDQNATSEYIEFLCQRGSISHVVSSPPGATVSTLALTQRCLASGIQFPVPLPDGSVGINVSGDIPAALAALDLVIEVVPGAGSNASADSTDPAFEANEESEEAMESETSLGESDPDAADDAVLSEGVDPPPEEFADDVTEDEGDAPAKPPGAAIHDGDFEDSDEDEAEDGVPMFMRSGAQSKLPLTVEDAPDASETEREDQPESLSADNASESDINGCQADDASTAEWGELAGVHNDGSAPLGDVLAKLSELEAQIDSFVNGQSELGARFDTFSNVLEDMASRPVPRPDATEFNRGMARMTAAFAQMMRRVDAALDALATPHGAKGPDISGSLADGLTAIAEAVRASSTAPGAASSELAVISSMQETLSHQLAKLIEASQATRPPAMEEFLLDLRHATAELLAEQTRLAKAG